MTTREQVGQMMENVNGMMDRREYSQALATVGQMLKQTQEGGNPDPVAFAFCEHYFALVILDAWDFILQCARGQHGAELQQSAEDSMVQWAPLLPQGHTASRMARDLMPEYQPGLKMGARYDELAAKHDVFRTGVMMSTAHDQQVKEMISHADGLRGQREYLAAIDAYDTALSFLRDIGYSDPGLEGQLHYQIGTCILNGHHYAACWAAGDEGPEMALRESEGQLMDRFVALMPRGIAEAYRAADMLPGDERVAKLIGLFEDTKSRAPSWFDA